MDNLTYPENLTYPQRDRGATGRLWRAAHPGALLVYAPVASEWCSATNDGSTE